MKRFLLLSSLTLLFFLVSCTSKKIEITQIDINAIISKYHMVKIPAGEFMMGSPSDEGSPREYPRHKVYLDEFYISAYEVTFDEYDHFCDDTGRRKPSDWGWGRGQHPVISVKWGDAVAYCKWLSRKTGVNFRLPTEAEWEKACRAGSDGKWCFDDNELLLMDYAWYRKNSGFKTHPVGQKKPNAFGIYDMHGNVSEYCSDRYGENYYSSSPSRNPKGPRRGRCWVNRGGCWDRSAVLVRSAVRSVTIQGLSGNGTGFRIVMTLH